jgi:predicted extracellular nuclease
MPISLTKTKYTQNFDSLANTGTSSLLPDGFTLTEVGGTSGNTANTMYSAGTGSSNAGDTYSFGATNSTERALGTLQSGSNVSTIGASFTNDTGETITALQISFTGEQYRLGTTGRADRLDFQYSVDGGTTWLNADQLDFSSPVTAGTVGLLDGNAAANRTLVTGEISGLSIPANATFLIRWTDFNASGADDGLAIDNFELTPVTTVVATPTLSISDVTILEGQSGTSNAVFTVTLSSPAAGAVTVDYATADGTATAGGDYTPTSGSLTFAPGETTKQISVPIVGDVTIEQTENFVLNLSNPSGATIADGQGQGTITNDDVPPVQPGVLSIGNASVIEGDSGTTDISFSVTRANGSDGAVSATWSFVAGTATAGDFSGPLSGTVEFAAGQTSATIILSVVGDREVEPNESFNVNLSNPTGGATIGTASGAGTIRNDDVPPLNLAVFVNEVHYDNSGNPDTGERIEIAAPAGTDLTGWTLVLYNGNGGVTYNATGSNGPIALSGVVPNQDDGYGTVSVAAPGVQNGSPDGFALVDPFGRVVQFLSYEGAFVATNGPAVGMTSTDIGVAEGGSDQPGLSLQLTGTGTNYVDFTWTSARDDNFGSVNDGQNFLGPNETGLVRITDASIAEGNAGTQQMTFTVFRGGGIGTSASVDYQLVFDGKAGASDLAPGQATSGTIVFGVGQSSAQITVAVTGDTAGEPTERFSVQLSNPIGNITIADGAAVGTIVNDDPITAAIFEIQGESHRSDYEGQVVTTSGIVTAVRSSGFFVQDPSGDGNTATSDAIFVATAGAPTVAIGDAVQINGVVMEFLPGNSQANLTTTQINASSINVMSSGNALPVATLIGADGMLPPSTGADDDGFTLFQPQEDALDFYESLEGMRVTVQAPTVAANAEGSVVQVLASGGAGATGVNARGGITISEGDFNPERIYLFGSDGLLQPPAGGFGQGDRLSDATGIMSYFGGHYEVLLTGSVGVVAEAPALVRETTSLDGDRDHLTVANYNVENLDPGDAQTKFDIIASDILLRLSAPDIIAVQEIQDADGAGMGSDISGAATAAKLIDAIKAAGGPSYVYVEIAPAANSSGGEPGGNIRNGYFYNPERVGLVEGSLAVINDPAFEGTRKPLVATFTFNGEEVTLINVHFTSRGGSQPLFGANQPPANGGEAARVAQSTAVAAYIEDRLAADPKLKLGVLGDFNGFYFEPVSDTIEAKGLTNLHELNPVEERYTYLFEGNYQALDNFLVTASLLGGPGATQYDVVHINSEQLDNAQRATDHDPSVARFFIEAPNAAPVAKADAISVDEDAASGNLWNLLLGNDSDLDPEDILSIKSVDGTGTLGSLQFDAATKTLVYVADSESFDALAPGTTAVDRFTYTITDDDGLTSTATVEVTVKAVDDTVRIDGGTGSDRLTGGSGEDIISGGTGNDVIFGGAGLDQLDGGSGNDLLYGGTGSDRLTGGTGNDQLFGEAGNDRIDGGSGNDQLFGGDGNDRLSGGSGSDVFVGGAGSDMFLFDSSGGNDLIRDFDVVLDRLVLADGVSVRKTVVRDFDGDGVADLRISLTNGGGDVTLSGVSDFGSVKFAPVAEFLL